MVGLSDFFTHIKEVSDSLSDNENIRNDKKRLKANIEKSLPMLSKDPQNVSIGDMLSSGIGVMPLTFAGKMAKNAPIDKFSLADKMARNNGLFDYPIGSPEWIDANKLIHKETGIHYGVDNKPKFEIDDSFSSMKKGDYHDGGRKTKLVNELDHNDLYSSYPELKDVNIKVDKKMPSGTGYYDESTSPPIGIGAYPYYGEKEGRSPLLHELQHYIQDKEGFSKGGDNASPFKNNDFDDYVNRLVLKRGISIDEAKKYASSTQGKNEFYKLLAGEAEARAVQSRMNMSLSDRENTFPLDSFDRKLSDLIIRLK
jgi:hypothetical protein